MEKADHNYGDLKDRSRLKKGSTCEANSHNDTADNDDQVGIDSLIGHFGKYQLMIFVFKILIGVTSAFNNLGVTFYAPTSFISYRCADQQLTGWPGNLTINPVSSASPSSLFPSSQLHDHYQLDYYHSSTLENSTINYRAPVADDDRGIVWGFLFGQERSRRRNHQNFNYDTPLNLEKQCSYPGKDKKNHTCSHYVYDTGIWISTIVDEWNMVCNRAWLVSLTQSLYMSGFIVSFLSFGYLSDRFGRWRSLLLGAIIEIVSGLACAFSGSLFWFMVFRFLLGVGNAGRSSSSYLVMIEWVGPKWRMQTSTLGSLGWICGYCAMPWITLYFLHFRHMQLFVCFYEAIFLIWLMRLPESPRWLLTHRRFDEAYKVLLRAARFNNLIKDSNSCEYELQNELRSSTKNMGDKPFDDRDPKCNLELSRNGRDPEMGNQCPNPFVETSNERSSNPIKKISSWYRTTRVSGPSYSIAEYDLRFKKIVDAVNSKEFTEKEDKLNILDLFKWKHLRRYSLILFFIWAANSFIYYGIVLGVGDFGGRNLFVSFSIAGIVEAPSIAFTIICMKLLPRKTANIMIFVTIGLLCCLQLPLGYFNLQWLQQVTMMLAKLVNSCSFTCILYQTMELFPTSIRQTAYSSCALAGRIGSIMAPFIKQLSSFTNPTVPIVIYALLSFVEAALATGLPETKGKDLPDTLLEAERPKKSSDLTSKLCGNSQDAQSLRLNS